MRWGGAIHSSSGWYLLTHLAQTTVSVLGSSLPLRSDKDFAAGSRRTSCLVAPSWRWWWWWWWWGYFTLSMGHLPIRFCFICPSFCFISPSNLLHFPNKLLHLPNKLLHFPNRLLHFPNKILTSPSLFCFTLPKTRTPFFDIFPFFSSSELNFE